MICEEWGHGFLGQARWGSGGSLIAWVFVLPDYPGVLALSLAQLGDPAKADQLLRRRAL